MTEIDKNINHPNYYKTENGENIITAIKQIIGKEKFQGFCEGNIIKYIARYKQKNGIEDLKKARNYIDILIDIY